MALTDPPASPALVSPAPGGLPDAALASYVPAVVLERIHALGGALREARVDTLHGTLLFADISGFTALTERLAARGPAGVEALVRRLNGYFGALIEVLLAHGGDVLKFAGDALVVLFPALGPDGTTAAVQRAALCGLAAQQALVSQREDAEGMVLSLKIAIASGSLACAFLGGERGRWEMVVFGSPLLEAGRISGHCEPGAVVVGPSSWRALGAQALGVEVGPDVRRLTALRERPAVVPLIAPALTGEAARAAWSFVPYAIRARLIGGQGDWLAESRRITVIFVTLPGHASDTSLERTQELMLKLQQLVYRVEGSVNKISVDDKGLSLIAVLGMPPLSHEDDPRRGLTLALDMHDLMVALRFTPSIGVTTGRAFCGVIGNLKRREYTMIGDIVNLSARLMVASAGGVLCDQATRDGAGAHFDYGVVPPLKLKGKKAPVAVFQPTRRSVRRAQGSQGCVGRDAELAQFEEALAEVAQGGAPRLLLLEGEPGIGKTRLLAELRTLALARGLKVLNGEADSIDRSTAGLAWREVLADLLGFQVADAGTTEAAAKVASALASEAALTDLAPLLCDLLPLPLAATVESQRLSGEARAAALRQVLLHLLAQRTPLVLILDDLQWLDSASWALLLAALRLEVPLLLAAATRPQPESDLLAEWRELLKQPRHRVLRLEGLDDDAVATLAQLRLGVGQVPRTLVRFLADRTQGNPFFIEQLLAALRDGELLEFTDGACGVRAGVDLARQANLPDTVEGLITQRIDHLGPTEQLSLKVASVVGRAFGADVVNAIFPLEHLRGQLHPHLDTLARQGLTRVDGSEAADSNYAFRQVATQEVAYNLMLFSQRRALHLAVADWYEATFADCAPHYAVLAHHLVQAGATDRAIQYLVLAADQALDRFACAEAVRLYADALRLAGERPQQIDGARLAHCQRRRGTALYLLGRLDEGIAELRRGLEHTALPVPVSRGACAFAVLRELGGRLLRRRTPPVLAGSAERVRQTELAQAWRDLALCHYTRSERLDLLLCGLRALRLAEPLGASPDLAEALAIVSVIASGAGKAQLAKRFALRAEALLPQLDDPARRGSTLFILSLYRSIHCQWENAMAFQHEVVTLAEALSNWRLMQNGLYGQARCAMRCGQLALSQQLYARVEQLGRRVDNGQAVAWGLAGQLQSPLAGQDIQAAERIAVLRDLLEAEASSGRGHVSVVDQALGTGAIALAQLRQGQPEAAEAAAIRAGELALSTGVVATHMLDPLCWAAEVQFARWRDIGDAGRARRQRVAKLCVVLERYAAKYPLAVPIAQRIRGEWAALCGQKRRAIKLLERAVVGARKLDMVCEAARCLHALVRPEVGSPKAMVYREAAAAAYGALGMAADLKALGA